MEAYGKCLKLVDKRAEEYGLKEKDYTDSLKEWIAIWKDSVR